MEGVPLRLVLSLFLTAAVLAMAFYEITSFSAMNEQKNFADDITKLYETMQSLVTMGDYGSFSKLEMRVPGGGNLTFDNATNKIIVTLANQTKAYNASAWGGSLTLYRYYGPGTYSLRVFYGDIPAAYASKTDVVAFK